MSVLRKLVCLAAGVGALMFVAGAQAASSAAPSGEFTGGSFTCLQYSNGLGDNSSGKMQSNLAHLWIMGYMAGYYKTLSKLEMNDDAGKLRQLDEFIAQKCKEFPQATILAMSGQMLVSELHALPNTVAGDFSPATYTCGQHVDNRTGAAASANKADLAEMWAFAFIQGAKNATEPNMEIKIENKAQLMAVMNKACGGSRDTLFLDLAALVAAKVKIQ